MTLLVTGGAGFIGGNFVLDWLANPDAEPIVVLDRLTYAGNLENLSTLSGDPRFKFVQGDISDLSLVGHLLRHHSVRAVLNFAAESHVDRSIEDPEGFVKTNVMGTFYLLEAVRLYWQNLNVQEQLHFRFLHISTDEVYGSLEAGELPFSEDNRYEPNNPYSASKAAADHLVRAWHHTYDLPVLTTNSSNNYGPYQFPEKLIPLMILQALTRRELPIYGDGQQIRDWLFVADHCAAIRLVLEKGCVGETYNIGGRSEKTNLEVVRMICGALDQLKPRLSGGSYADQIVFVRDRQGHDRRYAIDATKITQELGWRPIESFEVGMRKTIQWYLDHPDWVLHIQSSAYRNGFHEA